MDKNNIEPEVEKLISKKPNSSKEMFFMLRDLVFKAGPEIEEKKKWGMPHYDLDGIMLGIGLFKNHTSIWFHKGALMKDPERYFKGQEDKKEMKQIKFNSPGEIDEKKLLPYIKEAIDINKKGIKINKKKKGDKTVRIPEDLKQALSANEKAQKNFNNFAYTYRKEYVDWIEDAKRDSTREKRLKDTVELCEKNKKKHEKYAK